MDAVTVAVDTAEAGRKLAALKHRLGWLDSIADARRVPDGAPE